jgi:hypothetical protein
VQEDGVDDAEDGDVGSDAEGEYEGDDGGEGAFAAAGEGAECEFEILEEGVESGDAAGFALEFFGLGDGAEAEEGLAAGFGGVHAGAEVVGDGGVEVEGDFGFEFGVQLLGLLAGEGGG